jgi:hypothetical protein
MRAPTSLILPTPEGALARHALAGTPLTPRAPAGPLPRVAFAAAHVVSDPLAERDPWTGRPAVDWDATLAVRRALWDQGLGLAEAMDTAQRGMGVDWETARELIGRTMAEAKAHPLAPRVACGAGTDHAAPEDLARLDAIAAAYAQQMEAIEAAGGQIILMATRALPALGAGPDAYAALYAKLIGQAAEPVILHWLGDMFDPALAGYWGAADPEAAADLVLGIIADNAAKVDGIKISLLDQGFEERFRARLPEGVTLYTGDDFNYPALIAGDGTRHSHALLGIFAAIAPAAAQALEALGQGDRARYDALMAPTVPLAREIFRAPTQFYKAGIAFLSWLNGAQAHFVMPAGFQSSRDITHYAQVFRLADAAGLLARPDLAIARMSHLLALHGIDGEAR